MINKTEETMPLTQELGRFIAGLRFERLPAEAVEIAPMAMATKTAMAAASTASRRQRLIMAALL